MRARPCAVLLLLVLATALLVRPGLARAAPVALADEELARVSGRDGIGIAFNLDWNAHPPSGGGGESRLVAGFRVDGTTSYAVLDGLGGSMTVLALSLDLRQRADGGGDYVDIGLPGFIGFSKFGFRAMAAQTDPLAPIAAGTGYGGLQLDGSAAMTGRVYLWAR